MDISNLGKKIKELREAAGKDQQQIADLFGFSGYQQISKWETGKSMPSIEQIIKLNEEFKFNLFNVLADPMVTYEKEYFKILQEVEKRRQKLGDELLKMQEEFSRQMSLRMDTINSAAQSPSDLQQESPKDRRQRKFSGMKGPGSSKSKSGDGHSRKQRK